MEDRIVVRMITTAAWAGGTAEAGTNVFLPADIAQDFISGSFARAVVDPAVVRRVRDEIETAEGIAAAENADGVMNSGKAKRAVVNKPVVPKELTEATKKAGVRESAKAAPPADDKPAVVTSQTLEAVADLEPVIQPVDEVSDADLAKDLE